MKERLKIAIPVSAGFWLLLVCCPPAANLLALVIILRSLAELLGSCEEREMSSFPGWAMLFSFAYLCHCAFGSGALLPAFAAFGLIALLILQGFDPEGRDGIRKMSLTVFAWCYVVYLGSYFFRMENLCFKGEKYGIFVLIASVCSIKLGDAAAYFFGSRFGKHKLIPRISPNKSWEGLGFGFLGNILPAPFLTMVPGVECHHAILLCLVIGVAALAGDLCESMLKRELGVKDMSSSLPGFGGALDIIDSLLFGLPAAYWFLVAGGFAVAG